MLAVCRFHPLRKFREPKGLHQEIVCATLQALDLIGGLVMGCENDDGDENSLVV